MGRQPSQLLVVLADPGFLRQVPYVGPEEGANCKGDIYREKVSVSDGELEPIYIRLFA